MLDVDVVFEIINLHVRRRNGWREPYQGQLTKQYAVKGAGLQRVQLPPVFHEKAGHKITTETQPKLKLTLPSASVLPSVFPFPS